MDTGKKILDKNTDYFGLRLRALIERKGKTIDVFADEFGIARSTAHNWLNLSRPPFEKHWKPLSEYFGVSENYIVFGRPDVSDNQSIVSRSPVGMSRNDDTEDDQGSALMRRSKESVKIRGEFQPPAPVPTREDCQRHIDEYLKRAEREPGGIGYAYRMLLRDFLLMNSSPLTKNRR